MSSSFAAEAGHVPKPTTTATTTTTAASANASHPQLSSPSTTHQTAATSLHTHRQNHNSSKLPAFRFADLNKKDSLALPLPSLLQHIPPSPVSPTTGESANPGGTDQRHDDQERQLDPAADRDLQQQQQQQQQSHQIPVSSSSPEDANSSRPATTTHHHPGSNQNPASPQPTNPATSKSETSPIRSRASTYQPPSSATTTKLSTSGKRPASFPTSHGAEPESQRATAESKTSPPSASQPHRRTRGSLTSDVVASAPGPPSSLNSRRLQAAAAAQGAPPAENTTKDWAQGQRELLLPKALQTTISDDRSERRRSRPPVSFRAPAMSNTSGRAVIPPIRSFRSSGSRKSLVLDMNARPLRSYEDGDDMDDSDQRDRTLRALEGRSENDYRQITPPDSAEAAPDGESTADIFMRIAREDSTRRGADESGGEGSAITRVARSLHRRPLSAAVPSYHTTSPPQVTRRLSDQRETSRTRRLADEQPAQSMTRELAYRAISKEKPTLNLDDIRSRTAASVGRPSPITPRSQTFQDAGAEGGYPYSRRRPSLTESSPGTLPSRTSTFKHTYGLPKTYNSSPLVPKHADPHHVSEASHGPEGTESTSSTAAPSTVWDELDDLKSRIHRLELTGKLPPTSGSAMSRASDDRPPTATTNATTMSASPKRGSGNSVAQAEASSTTSSQRETQPILLSALSKSKPFISPDVYEAIESAATDALALSQLMGTVGQPGPISSGASTIGVGGPATVTDRQLRRKADSICRSLTGLCLALSEEASQKKPTQTVATPSKEKETVASPTVSKTVAGVAAQRRGSAVIDQATIKIDPVTSPPRAPTRLEERRANLLNSSALPSPRYALAPGTTTDQVAGPGRKSSLLISRTRRAGTEEPEDSGRKSSLLLRTRRAGTEEPEEGRKTSLLLRQRRGTNDDEEDTRIRAPSRAVTEIAGLRAAQREYPTHVPHVPAEPAPLASSALPRRRLVPSSLNSRLVAPSPPTSMSTRRYLDRATPERDTIAVADKLAEDRPQRQLSLGQAAMLNRTGSLSRRRDSAIPLSASASQVGSYR